MKLSEMGEFGLINRIQRIASKKPSSAFLGIGDDAAAFKITSSRSLLATTDLLIEGVHFDLSLTDFYSLGWKSAAVNISDIAAMGGVPRFCLSALGMPGNISLKQVADFYQGFIALLEAYSASLIGGDTCSSPAGLFISVTAIGEAKGAGIVTRQGAKPGDRIFVTGTLGDSAAGLELLRNAPRDAARKHRVEAECGLRNEKPGRKNAPGAGAGKQDSKSEILNPKSEIGWLAQRHLRPVPRVEWGVKLAVSGSASAMIDISDGLSSDLSHICEQSRVGAVIIADNIPLSSALRSQAEKLSKPVLNSVLSGGEDYELLFTVPRGKLKQMKSLAIDATEIGMITSGKGMSLVDSRGRKKPLARSGYDHFVKPQKVRRAKQ